MQVTELGLVGETDPEFHSPIPHNGAKSRGFPVGMDGMGVLTGSRYVY